MLDTKTLRKIAAQILNDLRLETTCDNILWQRTERVVLNVRSICGLEEVVKAKPYIDKLSLLGAAYFSETGYIKHSPAKPGSSLSANHKSCKAGPMIDNLFESSAEIAQEQLAGLADKGQLNRINRIITQSGSDYARLTEAMILSDARDLDDMGAVGVLQDFKHNISRRKGIAGMLQARRNKTRYGYWQARLDRGFHFDSVRKLAEQRLQAARLFVEQLNTETDALDIAEISVNTIAT